MEKKCIICGSSENKVVFREFEVDILKCKNCGHVYSSYGANENYDGYFGHEEITGDDQYWWDEAHREMYDDFCKKFIEGKSGKLLDVGCGLGYFLKKMREFPQWESYGYEISQTAVEFAKNKLGLENVYCGRIEECNFKKERFDIITLWDVVEHIALPDGFISYLNSLIKKDGLLFIHTPNIKIQLAKAKLKRILSGMEQKGHYLEAKDHLNVYSPKTIKILLERNGFSKVKFIHLKPIQSVSGSKSRLLRLFKNFWFYLAVGLYYATFRRVNIDNLFIVSKK